MRPTSILASFAIAAFVAAGCTSDPVGDDTTSSATAVVSDPQEQEPEPEEPELAEAEAAAWDVCDHAEHAPVAERVDDDLAGVDADTDAARLGTTLRDACAQVRAGVDPDRPDVVACYSRTDEPGGVLAGEIATETCARLAMGDQIGIEDVDALARDEGYDRHEQVLAGWDATTPAPEAVQLLGGEPGEPAWYVNDELAGDVEQWLADGVAAWDARLGDASDVVCQWIVGEVEAVLDDGDATTDDDLAIRLVLGGTVDGVIGDGLPAIVAERCGR